MRGFNTTQDDLLRSRSHEWTWPNGNQNEAECRNCHLRVTVVIPMGSWPACPGPGWILIHTSQIKPTGGKHRDSKWQDFFR